MGKRGPAPTPAKVLQLRGTYRPDRDAPNAPSPETAAPSCPTWLGKSVPWGREAVREWSRIAPLLEGNQLLTELDRANLAAYCDAYARWWHFRREVARHGAVQVTESGYAAQRPEVTMMNRALEDMKKFGALFGLSPSDRRNVSATPKEEADTAADFLFGGRKQA